MLVQQLLFSDGHIQSNMRSCASSACDCSCRQSYSSRWPSLKQRAPRRLGATAHHSSAGTRGTWYAFFYQCCTQHCSFDVLSNTCLNLSVGQAWHQEVSMHTKTLHVSRHLPFSRFKTAKCLLGAFAQCKEYQLPSFQRRRTIRTCSGGEEETLVQFCIPGSSWHLICINLYLQLSSLQS